MLDTNTCIYVIKSLPPTVQERFNLYSQQLCISSVTLAELLYGAEKSQYKDKNLAVVEAFASRLQIFGFDERAAAHYAEIRAELERSGTPIGPYDLMIAGHARSRGLVVVTNNTKVFQRVSGLRLENWR